MRIERQRPLESVNRRPAPRARPGGEASSPDRVTLSPEALRSLGSKGDHIDPLKAAIQSNDMSTAAGVAASLQGTSSQLGLAEVSDLSSEVASKSRSHDASLGESVDKLSQALERVFRSKA